MKQGYFISQTNLQIGCDRCTMARDASHTRLSFKL